MCCQPTMILKKKKNMTNQKHNSTLFIPPNTTLYDYQYYPESKCTVVAMEATLDDFKVQPVMVNGQLMQRINERSVKDCRCIDGCIYLHLGKVSDSVLTELIEKFQKAKKEVKDWKPKGRLLVRDNYIKI